MEKTVKAAVFQQKDVRLYFFTMNARDLEPLCFVEAAARDKQKGLQRVTEPSRLREIGAYLNERTQALLPNNIILNLKSAVKVIETGDGSASITFPSEEGDYAFVVDGQHRLFSFREEYRCIGDNERFDLAVVALHNATEELVGQTFVQINCNQKPVNKDLLIQMKAILGLLDTDMEQASVDLIHALDEGQESPLKNRILRYPKEKNKWVKVGQLLPIIHGLIQPGGSLADKSHAERKAILISYFNAVAKTFPDAWNDEKRTAYALLLPTGLQMMLALLPDVMKRCEFHDSFTYNFDTFKRQLAPLEHLVILGGWAKASVEDAIAVENKRKMFLGQLREALRIRPPTN